MRTGPITPYRKIVTFEPSDIDSRTQNPCPFKPAGPVHVEQVAQGTPELINLNLTNGFQSTKRF